MLEYGDLVYRIAVSHLKNAYDAEDVFQEVFISLVKNAQKIEDETHLKHWLIRATINRTKNLQLCFWKKRVDCNDIADTATPSFEDNALQLDEIRAVIASIPERLRIVVYLHYYEEYSLSEIAVILNIPEGTVKSRLFNARKMLKDKLMEVDVSYAE